MSEVSVAGKPQGQYDLEHPDVVFPPLARKPGRQSAADKRYEQQRAAYTAAYNKAVEATGQNIGLIDQMQRDQGSANYTLTRVNAELTQLRGELSRMPNVILTTTLVALTVQRRPSAIERRVGFSEFQDDDGVRFTLGDKVSVRIIPKHNFMFVTAGLDKPMRFSTMSDGSLSRKEFAALIGYLKMNHITVDDQVISIVLDESEENPFDANRGHIEEFVIVLDRMPLPGTRTPLTDPFSGPQY